VWFVLAQTELPYVTSIGAIAGVVVLGTAMFAWNRQVFRPMRGRAEDAEERATICEYRQYLRDEWMRQNGIGIPDDVRWALPPSLERDRRRVLADERTRMERLIEGKEP
jgi:hypothetical protein